MDKGYLNTLQKMIEILSEDFGQATIDEKLLIAERTIQLVNMAVTIEQTIEQSTLQQQQYQSSQFSGFGQPPRSPQGR